MFGTLLLEAARAFGGAGEIAGIDLVEYGIRGRRQVEFRAAERTSRSENETDEKEKGAKNWDRHEPVRPRVRIYGEEFDFERV
jgi:hypothetical protein